MSGKSWAIIAAALLAASVANADSFSGHLDPVLDDFVVPGITGSPTKKQDRALRTAFKALGVDGTSLAHDLKSGKKAFKKLEKAFPGDETLDGLLGTATDGLDGDVRALRAGAAAAMDRQPAGGSFEKSLKLFAKVDGLLLRADESGAHNERVKWLGKALKKLGKVEAFVAKLDPVTAARPGARLHKSGPVQITADGAFVWTANVDNDSVSRMDTATETVTEFPLPAIEGTHRPTGLSVLDDGSEVWVACHDSDTVYVLDGGTGEVLETLTLPWGSGPLFVAIAPDQEHGLVTLHRSNALASLDVQGREVAEILDPVFLGPTGIAWLQNGTEAWVTHRFAVEEHSKLTRVDNTARGLKVRSRITAFATDPRSSSSLEEPYDLAEGGYQTQRGHVAPLPAVTGRRELWIPTQYNGITQDGFTPDTTVQSTLRRLMLDDQTLPNDHEDKVVLTAVFVHRTNQGSPYVGPGWDARISGPVDLAFNDDGTMAYQVNESSDDVLAFPVDTPAVRPDNADPLPEIPVGHRPTGIAISPVTDTAYVLNELSRSVSVVNLTSLRAVREIPLTPITGETMDENVLTGARLFHTSADPRVSGNGKVSCASCHIDAEHDGRDWAFHALPGNHGPQSTPTLKGLVLSFGPKDSETGFGQLHRSGDRDEVQDFEHTFQGVQMGGTGFLGSGAQAELGTPNAGRDADLDAVADYLMSLAALPRSPHREDDGSLSEAAVRGAAMFLGDDRPTRPLDAGCATCHVPETGFVDFAFHDVGSRRPGQENELNNTSVPGRSGHLWEVNTPTLVGVWHTPPYSGAVTWAATVPALLEDMAGHTLHGRTDGLTVRQLRDLEEFVLSLDGNTTAEEVRAAQDTHPPRLVRVAVTSLSRIDCWFNETVDAATAGDTANWSVRDGDGNRLAVTRASRDDTFGDRVTLTVALHADDTFTVSPGAILDEAGGASGGTANELDTEDRSNQRTVVVGDTLTITLGASGAENLQVKVHDSGFTGPNLSTWNHDHVVFFKSGTNPVMSKGFVRFEWQDALVAATGIEDAADLLNAAIDLHPDQGHGMEVEARRCLQAWADPEGTKDFNSGATGAPTWRDHSHPDGRWNRAGAGEREEGVDGAVRRDYDGDQDTAFTPDVVVEMEAINEPLVLDGAGVLDAFRFWFENPDLDYGYALEPAAGETQSVQCHNGEVEQGRHAPVLTITYSIAGDGGGGRR